MAMTRDEILDFGKWLASERAKRTHRGKPLSTGMLAQLANTYAQVKRRPIAKIHQQQISQLENVGEDKGPKREQPWWRVLREFIEEGELDTLLAAAAGPIESGDGAVVVDFPWAKTKTGETVVRTPDGEVVGRIVWGKR